MSLDDPDCVAGVREGRYEAWVVEVDRSFQEQDPRGTPAALLDGEPVDSSVLYDGQALGNLLRGLTSLAPVERVCAAPGTGPEPSRRWDDLVHAQQDGHPARARRTASS